MTMNDRLRDITSNISEQINQDLAGLAAEEQHPSFSADEMDAKIKAFRERIKKLREIRNEIEHIFTGASA